jgi:CheY-like chemotaxis protein
MDEATRRHLFEPFFTTKRDRNNTGLGLATVFGIVSHCGGHIEVQSEPGEGAVFRIEIPRMEPPDSGSRIPAPQAAAAPRGSGTILVVEDREEVRNLTCRMLEELGYRTIAAASGLEALQIALAHPGGVPILLTDVVMPGMNGRELAERLLSVYPGMKTIFMSGYTDRILTDTAALDSSSAYLQKPFTLAQLAEILRQVGG